MDQSTILTRDKVEVSLSKWRESEKTALELLQIVGSLRFDKSIEVVLFRRDIYDTRPSTVLNHHSLLGEKYGNAPLSIDVTLALTKAIDAIPNLPPCRIDLGKLGIEWAVESADFKTIKDFIDLKLGQIIGQEPINEAAKDIVLYGFGRIGRLAARRIIELTGKGDQLRLRAIVIRPKLKDRYEEAKKRAALLESDSVHGDFHGNIIVGEDGNELIINGNRVQLIYAKQPTDIDYTIYGIQNALVIDNTGVWRDKEGLSLHLRPGATQVMLTAPGKGAIPNIVYGINHRDVDFGKEQIFTAASCTTNAIVPVLSIMDAQFGIHSGHVETIHAYTNDQNLLDNFHKKPRRGRGAPVNMVLTTTGAATAATKVLPQLAGKLTGNAIRVPTPNVSLAILKLSLDKSTSREDLDTILRNAALEGDLVEQIHYSISTEYVSSNAIGMTSTCVVDAPSTIVSADGKNVLIYLWYDNEYGYTCQVVRLAKHAARVRRFCYY